MIKPRNNNLNKLEEMKTSDMRVALFSDKNKIVYFVLKNNRLYSLLVEQNDGVKPGNVYTGIVKKYNKATGGYFVAINDKDVVFLPQHKMHNVMLCSERKYDGCLHEGEQIIIQIIKSAYKEKRAMGSCKIKIDDMDKSEVESILENARHYSKYSLVYSSKTYLEELCFDNSNNIKIVCNDSTSYEFAKNKLRSLYNDKEIDDLVKLYNDNAISLSSLYGLKAKCDECTNSKVYLKNGGYIFINPTEAMIVIDVNSGKNDGKKDLDASILDTNLNAVDEIIHNIQCRNLSGIIIIDFVNQKSQESNIILIEKLKKGLESLNPPGVFVDMTKLGLVEITRPKIRSDIYENISQLDKTILI